jgi:nucleoside-diphosphate-sugar epimerase
MILIITGAAGFLGRYVVAEALRSGHEVRALVRPARDDQQMPWQPHPRLHFIRHDLDQTAGLSSSLKGADAVIHLAAKASADVEATASATRNLLEAMDAAGLNQLVAISSFSVYDFLALAPEAILDESAPLETRPDRRDAYARAKLRQEQLTREFADQRHWRCAILRPGAIYGKNCLWTARLGMPVGKKLWLRIGNNAALPLTYVENCAQAIVLAAENTPPGTTILNIVDDNSPSQRRYASLAHSHIHPGPLMLPVPRSAVRLLASTADQLNRLLLRSRAPLPGLLVPARFEARFKPLRFPNNKLKTTLGWNPRYTLEEALNRCDQPEVNLLALS